MTDVKHHRKHTLAVLVENHQGVLARIASLIAAKGYNIDSLSVAETLDPSVSRMTLSLHGTCASSTRMPLASVVLPARKRNDAAGCVAAP